MPSYIETSTGISKVPNRMTRNSFQFAIRVPMNIATLFVLLMSIAPVLKMYAVTANEYKKAELSTELRCIIPFKFEEHSGREYVTKLVRSAECITPVGASKI